MVVLYLLRSTILSRRSPTATSWWRDIGRCLRVPGFDRCCSLLTMSLPQGETNSPVSTEAAREVEERTLAAYEAFSMGGRAISTPSGWTRSLNTMEPLYEPLPHRQLAGFRPYPLK